VGDGPEALFFAQKAVITLTRKPPRETESELSNWKKEKSLREKYVFLVYLHQNGGRSGKAEVRAKSGGGAGQKQKKK